MKHVWHTDTVVTCVSWPPRHPPHHFLSLFLGALTWLLPTQKHRENAQVEKSHHREKQSESYLVVSPAPCSNLPLSVELKTPAVVWWWVWRPPSGPETSATGRSPEGFVPLQERARDGRTDGRSWCTSSTSTPESDPQFHLQGPWNMYPQCKWFWRLETAPQYQQILRH